MNTETLSRQSVLVVDDNPVVQAAIAAVLEDHYEVHTVENGTDALAMMTSISPNLVLLDIAMPQMDGYETCRKIRENSSVPIVFVSARDSLEERLRAFEVGGDDFIAKPFDGQILALKVERTLKLQGRASELSAEKEAMQQMANDLMAINGETRVLLDFLKQNLSCMHYDDLGQSLKYVIENHGLDCEIRLRHPEGVIRLAVGDSLSPLEETLLEKSEGLSGAFLYKQRLLIASPAVSLLVSNLSPNPEAATRLQNNLIALVEATEGLLQTITARREATLTTESLQVAVLNAHEATRELQADFHQQQVETSVLLHELIDKVESSYFSLGLTEGQEERISGMLREETEAVMSLFQTVGEAMDAKFSRIMDSLAPPRQEDDVWL